MKCKKLFALALAMVMCVPMSFFYLFLSSIRECLFDVNIYTSLPLALTANLINRFLHLFNLTRYIFTYQTC